MGTFVYAAPECLADARDVDHRSDVYSLGMTAVFAFRGEELPLEAPWKRLRFIKELDCPRWVKAVLAQATEPDREKRFGTMKEFCAALRAAFAKAPPARSDEAADSGPAPSIPFAHVAPRVDLPLLAGEIVNSIGMQFATIPAGKFLMGSTEAERDAVLALIGKKEMPAWLKAEGPQHEVEITRPFYLRQVSGHAGAVADGDGQQSQLLLLRRETARTR